MRVALYTVGTVMAVVTVVIAVTLLSIFVAGDRRDPFGTVDDALAAILILLGVAHWSMVAIASWAVKRHPGSKPLADLLTDYVVSATGATAIALVGLNYLTGHWLPKGGWYSLVVVGVLLMGSPRFLALVRFLRGR